MGLLSGHLQNTCDYIARHRWQTIAQNQKALPPGCCIILHAQCALGTETPQLLLQLLRILSQETHQTIMLSVVVKNTPSIILKTCSSGSKQKCVKLAQSEADAAKNQNPGRASKCMQADSQEKRGTWAYGSWRLVWGGGVLQAAEAEVSCSTSKQLLGKASEAGPVPRTSGSHAC